jgi:hypothetical protein
MTTVASRSRLKSTWLTGVAGLLLLSAAFVMMICAAPKASSPLHGGTTPAATQSALSAWTRPTGQPVITPSLRSRPGRSPLAFPPR